MSAAHWAAASAEETAASRADTTVFLWVGKRDESWAAHSADWTVARTADASGKKMAAMKVAAAADAKA